MTSLLAWLDDLPEGATPVTEWTPRAFLAIGVALTGIAYIIYFYKTNPEEEE
jgi:drug/metabolite transporter (DMT)-like permease